MFPRYHFEPVKLLQASGHSRHYKALDVGEGVEGGGGSRGQLRPIKKRHLVKPTYTPADPSCSVRCFENTMCALPWNLGCPS
jgi:hypothetical protein